MKRTTVKELYESPEAFDEKDITVAGWIRTMRASNAFGFIELADGSAFPRLQIVMEADKLPNYTEITKQNVGAAVIARGTLVLTPCAKQPFRAEGARHRNRRSVHPRFPSPKEKNVLGISPDRSASAAEDQHLSGRVPRALRGGVRHSPVFP